jgi:hypothetical protein
MLFIAVAHLLLRYVAYTAWCYAGALTLSPALRRRYVAAAVAACLLGAFRLLLGLVSGYYIFYEGEPAYLLPSMRLSHDELRASYFLIYVPLRLLEWGIVWALLRYCPLPAARRAEGGERERGGGRYRTYALLWVLAGVVLSSLLDLTMVGVEKHFSR